MELIEYLNKNDFAIESVNVYLGVKKSKADLKKEKEELSEEEKLNGINLYFLKKISFGTSETDEEKNIKKTITEELDKLKSKEHKNYDVNKEKGKVITLYKDDLKDIKVLQDIQGCFTKTGKILEYKNFDSDHISLLIARIVLSTKEVITFFIDYKYNSLLKVNNPFFRAIGEDIILKEKSEKIFILDLHPIAILFEDSFLMLSHKVEKIFDFNDFYDNQIKTLKDVIENVIDEKIDQINASEQKRFLVRGIKEQSIEKFNILQPTTKNERINKLRGAYKEKHKKDLDVSLDSNNQIKMKHLDAKGKLEIYKLLADKSSVKILGETLATTID